MADLNVEVRPLNDRGQLLLAGAFVLAVALIGLTIVLTSSSYTAALASQESDVVRGSDAVALRESVEADLTRQFAFIFDRQMKKPTGPLKDRFSALVGPLGNETTTHYSRRGRLVNVTRPEAPPAGPGLFIEGTHLRQQTNDIYAHPDQTGTVSHDWVVAENVELRNATFKVTSVPGPRNPADAFEMAFVTPSSGDWKLLLYRHSSTTELVIMTESPDGDRESCRRPDPNDASSAHVMINLGAGTADGRPCEALKRIDPDRHEYDIEITRGNNARGEYWMLLSEEPSSSNINTDGSRSQTNRAVYGARVRYRYHSASVEYETNIDIAPDEIS